MTVDIRSSSNTSRAISLSSYGTVTVLGFIVAADTPFFRLIHLVSSLLNTTGWLTTLNLLGRLPNPNLQFVHYAPLQPGINVPVARLLLVRSPALASTNKIQDAPASETKSTMSP